MSFVIIDSSMESRISSTWRLTRGQYTRRAPERPLGTLSVKFLPSIFQEGLGQVWLKGFPLQVWRGRCEPLAFDSLQFLLGRRVFRSEGAAAPN